MSANVIVKLFQEAAAHHFGARPPPPPARLPGYWSQTGVT